MKKAVGADTLIKKLVPMLSRFRTARRSRAVYGFASWNLGEANE